MFTLQSNHLVNCHCKTFQHPVTHNNQYKTQNLRKTLQWSIFLSLQIDVIHVQLLPLICNQQWISWSALVLFLWWDVQSWNHWNVSGISTLEICEKPGQCANKFHPTTAFCPTLQEECPNIPISMDFLQTHPSSQGKPNSINSLGKQLNNGTLSGTWKQRNADHFERDGSSVACSDVRWGRGLVSCRYAELPYANNVIACYHCWKINSV